MGPDLRVPYKTVDSVDIPTDIYLPSQTTNTKNHELAPVLIMIHGGAFMLGSASANNADQIQDCVERGWIVLAIEHRLCPGVNLLEGPMADTRDAMAWARSKDGGLARVLRDNNTGIKPDPERVMAMGTSAGGHLALSLAFNSPTPPLAILSFYGAVNFGHEKASAAPPGLLSKLPAEPPASFFSDVLNDKTCYIGGTSLEGQQQKQKKNRGLADADLSDPRQAFAVYSVAKGTNMKAVWPPFPHELEKIDPMLNIGRVVAAAAAASNSKVRWPPTCTVHGTDDHLVPIVFSEEMHGILDQHGVENKLIRVEGEGHTFAGMMDKGSKTWDTQRTGFDWLEGVLERSY